MWPVGLLIVLLFLFSMKFWYCDYFFSMFYADTPISVEWPASVVCRAWTRGPAAESSKASQRGGGTAFPKEAETPRGAELAELVVGGKNIGRSVCEDGWAQPFALEARQRHTAKGNSVELGIANARSRRASASARTGQTTNTDGNGKAAVVTYMNTLIEQGLGVDSRTLRVCLAACEAVWYSAAHQQRNATGHEL